MVSGAHVVLYSSDPEADRVFFRGILGFRFVDDGGGWLIFALPPAEVAVHPLSDNCSKSSRGYGARVAWCDAPPDV